jgi:hypothetical protein
MCPDTSRNAYTFPEATHPGVVPLTAIAHELVIGTPERFHCGKQIASYLGLVPEEKSRGERRRPGRISKPRQSAAAFLLGVQSETARRTWLNGHCMACNVLLHGTIGSNMMKCFCIVEPESSAGGAISRFKRNFRVLIDGAAVGCR